MRSLLCFLALLALMTSLSGCKDKSGNDKSVTSPESSNTPVDKQLSKDDYQKAMVLKNRGIAHLENKEWKDAEAALSELADLLPKNRLAQRNLAIGRVLALIDRESPFTRSGSPDKIRSYRDAVESANSAVQSFQQIASDSYDKALADLLLGKLLVHNDSPDQNGMEVLARAANALPEAADFRFAYAMAMDGHRDFANADSPKSAQLLTALKKSFELAPDNLFALQKLMQRQALCLRSKDPATQKLAMQIPDTLKSATELLKPLNESIRKQRRMDLISTINKALSAFDGSDSKVLMGPAMMTGNLLLPEIATQIDQRRLNKNLLEYLLFEFDDAFLAAADKAGAIPKLEPTVLTGFDAADGFPKLDNVTHIELLDMNLDGFDDLVVAHDGNIEIYSRGQDLQAEWSLLMIAPAGDLTLTSFLLVDIDRDFDKALSDVKAPWLLRDADGDQKIVKDPSGKNRWYDTDPDIVAWGEKGVVVLRNDVDEDGKRLLNVVPQEESINGINDVAAADVEADGDLDLVFATATGLTMWKNIDGSVFENMNDAASLPDAAVHSLRIADINRDLTLDFVTVSRVDASTQTVGVLENMLHGRFRWRELPTIIPKDEHVLISGGERSPVSSISIPFEPTQILTADFDNDSLTDALCVSGEKTVCLRGTGSGNFDSSAFPELDVGMQHACTSDVDDDGDLDIVFVSSDGSLRWLRNEGGNTNHWIDVVARAVPDDAQFPSNRVNMHAIGSLIEMRAGGLYHAEVITGPKIHLGLGKAKNADAIRIIWTDGIPQNVTVPELLIPRIGILAPQILKGSCPYIYTWTGEKFEFFSDCLWAAPLGLVQASGEIAPTREWENLLIPGESLVAKDGQYVLQLTEELWEVAYFDQVLLTAIDHPADVSIFTNEKVGPPNMAEHRIHTVKNPLQPKSVVDRRGKDLLPGLASQDGDYIQAFQGRVMQGLTDEWSMEFDLGDSTDWNIEPNNAGPRGDSAAKPNIRLFLVGWVFPTDTSLNVNIHQNPDTDAPAGPSIEVPDGNGGWKVARPFVGFPSGKTKAMVVDISDIFEGDDYRFRLTSSMELYWDHAFFTVNEQDAETTVQPCKLISGNLHYRGFSRRTYADNALFRNGRAPENYDYQSVTTQPRWPAISGRFTRYDDVTPLLPEHDDQMVVMGPGDELTVRFAVPQKPVPLGWKRDFVLHNVGYDKDADLNTIYGQSSEPFPFRSMTRYPFAPDDDIPDSPEYQQYIDEWQTREYSDRPFWNALRGNQ